MESPLVSVVMPCYNAEKYLSNAISSIINQSYHTLEILLIDDGSDDNTLEICKKFELQDERVVVIKNEFNLGLVKTLNVGITLAKGQYIARMDADDRSALDRIKTLVSFLEINKHIDVLGSKAISIDSEENELKNKQNLTYLKPVTLGFSAYFSQPFFHGSVIAKSSLLKKNPYSSEFLHSEDFELWLRILNQNFTLANLDAPLYYYRVNNEGVSIQNEALQINSHNKASARYLAKKYNLGLELKIVELLNARPTQIIQYADIKKSLFLFKNIFFQYNNFNEIELKNYFLNHRLEICIQGYKKLDKLRCKIYLLLHLVSLSLNPASLRYLINKIRVL